MNEEQLAAIAKIKKNYDEKEAELVERANVAEMMLNNLVKTVEDPTVVINGVPHEEVADALAEERVKIKAEYDRAEEAETQRDLLKMENNNLKALIAEKEEENKTMYERFAAITGKRP
jgi:hypothetical protein